MNRPVHPVPRPNFVERTLTPLGALTVVVTALFLLGLLATVVPPPSGAAPREATSGGAATVAGADSGAQSRLSLAGATLVCPMLGGAVGATDVIMGAALPGVAAGPDVPEPQARAVALVGAGNRPADSLVLAQRGLPVQARVAGKEARSYALRANGPLAPGLVLEQGRQLSDTETFGLADTACDPPSRDSWFVGGSSLTGARTLLVLANPGSTAALADVTAWDERGELVTPSLENVAVAPEESKIIRIDGLAPGSERIALRVSVSQGLMTAGTELRLVDGLDPLGLTWLPAAAAPAREQVIPGIPADGARHLQVLNPQTSAAIVSLRFRGADGAFVPAGLDAVSVPGQSVADLDLGAIALDAGITVELSSDVPVTAAARLDAEAAPAGLRDLAVSPAATTLDGPAGTWLRSGKGLSTTLTLSASTNMSATIDIVDSTGATLNHLDRALLAGATFELPVVLPPGGVAPHLAVVTPSEPGSLVVTRRVSGAADAPRPRGGTRKGNVLDVVALATARASVAVDGVVHDLTAGLPAKAFQ